MTLLTEPTGMCWSIALNSAAGLRPVQTRFLPRLRTASCLEMRRRIPVLIQSQGFRGQRRSDSVLHLGFCGSLLIRFGDTALLILCDVALLRSRVGLAYLVVAGVTRGACRLGFSVNPQSKTRCQNGSKCDNTDFLHVLPPGGIDELREGRDAFF